jgi:hypothetical protein
MSFKTLRSKRPRKLCPNKAIVDAVFPGAFGGRLLVFFQVSPRGASYRFQLRARKLKYLTLSEPIERGGGREYL